MVDDIPARMVFAGRRWTVSDTPTTLRPAAWELPSSSNAEGGGWRFQATDEDGRSLVFDVFGADDDWHVHRSYDY